MLEPVELNPCACCGDERSVWIRNLLSRSIPRRCIDSRTRIPDATHSQALAANSPVPVINALSDLYHPTQILADILTMIETYTSFALEEMPPAPKGKRFSSILDHLNRTEAFMGCLKGKKVRVAGHLHTLSTC